MWLRFARPKFLQKAIVQDFVIKQQNPRRAADAIKVRAKLRTPVLETLSRLLVLENLLRQLRRLPGPDRD
jgi:hypothetical protein